LQGLFHFMQGVGLVNPTERTLRRQLADGPGNINRQLPFLCLSIYVVAHDQNGWVRASSWRDLLQLLVGFGVIAELQPTLGGFQVALPRVRTMVMNLYLGECHTCR
jgi:hypothetical protein